jgi:hypothetical protein
VTCPACGLPNEAGARVCRNCGLPIASATDPLRGVAPGRVDMPSTQRSGLSATIGLILVVGLLLVGGTLAVSGGGFLGGGGRLGAGGDADPADAPGATTQPVTAEVVPEGVDLEQPTQAPSTGKVGTSFDYTCDDDTIKDVSRGRWFISEVAAGKREDEGGTYDQVYWTMTRQNKKKVKSATTVRMEWSTPKEAQDTYGIGKVQGNRAIIVTFDGPVSIVADQEIDDTQLQGEGIQQIKRVQLFTGADKKIRTAIGIKGDACARMEARGWGGKAQPANAKVILDIEDYGSGA